ncbi:hypothetical protein DSO57_1013453 [Entomophthora muscae]|uniref:Uncharacterized protein n=1 Tax=Entomophthora muscae TaxID=34485 RepID=A0ACC2SIR2_9FUNG|nr:hypothetical protein DSO57_1013453 [Entomophthora muscae]
MSGLIAVGLPSTFKDSPSGKFSYKVVTISENKINSEDPNKKLSDELGFKEKKALVLKIGEEYQAIDAFCPHQGYPLAHGNLVDIEDFGVCFGKAVSSLENDD